MYVPPKTLPLAILRRIELMLQQVKLTQCPGNWRIIRQVRVWHKSTIELYTLFVRFLLTTDDPLSNLDKKSMKYPMTPNQKACLSKTSSNISLLKKPSKSILNAIRERQDKKRKNSLTQHKEDRIKNSHFSALSSPRSKECKSKSSGCSILVHAPWCPNFILFPYEFCS